MKTGGRIREWFTDGTLGRLGLVWIYCPYPVLKEGLIRILETEAEVYTGREPPGHAEPDLVVLSADGRENLAENVGWVSELNPGSPVIVFGLRPDLPLAHAALKAGARGFVHAGMPPEQILRAATVVEGGALAAPRQLIGYLLTGGGGGAEEPLAALSARQREILELVGDGLANAQIAARLFLSESTVKQHLRAAYKVLGVRNRTEAAQRLAGGA